MQGTMKFFDRDRGFGFIKRAQGEDLFVHISNVQPGVADTLAEGQDVEFEVGGRPAGRRSTQRQLPLSGAFSASIDDSNFRRRTNGRQGEAHNPTDPGGELALARLARRLGRPSNSPTRCSPPVPTWTVAGADHVRDDWTTTAATGP